MSAPVLIAGLPGSGKRRWIAAQPEPLRFEAWEGGILPAERAVWWTLDLREPPDAALKRLLQPCLQRADAILGLFAEESPIEAQMRWREFLAPFKKSGTPLFFSHFLQAPPSDWPHASNRAAHRCAWPERATVRVRLPKVVLEHLLFVFQGLSQSTPMRFWRIRGVVETLEYVNAVAVEGSLSGLHTHAARDADGAAGWLFLQVENLDEPLLREALQAACAPGSDMDIRLISE